eukprot:7780684-Pyramimonas_sp.AAC.1
MLSTVSESPVHPQGLCNTRRHKADDVNRITGPRKTQCNESIARLACGLVPSSGAKIGHR